MLHSAVIRTTVLIQHYCVALMAVSGRISDSDQLHKHTSVETLEITQSLITAAQHCPSRHGHMVLLRIPSPALADWAFRQLCRVRGQLGLEHTFEIILGDPNQPLSVGQSFVEQIKVLFYRRRCSGHRTGPIKINLLFQKWLKIQEADWVPRTYLELEALPCILILSGAEPLGESLPRSQLVILCYLQKMF